MNKETFIATVKLADYGELEKAALTGFYLHTQGKLEEYSLRTLVDKMVDFGLSKPNEARLKPKLTGSGKPFVKGKAKDTYKLSLKQAGAFATAYPTVLAKSEEIVTDETILPDSLLKGTRNYLVMVGQQINASYHYNIIDGCAMLMRRMMEMLIVLVYIHKGREAEVKNEGGGYLQLAQLIAHARKNKVFNLTKASDDMLDEFRQLGNYAAHGLTFQARKVEIDRIRISFRACVEELLHEAGLVKPI